ncbi:HAMP domain-containing histidine kinase [Fodinisporobacter ferrooxydans]|uniref:histidine kinase n=1 Tax=Fodinisporobacter ferrooxydans TaxID=2901836 RepID=A0ABY4CLK4_9BACL|nr:HAMP domain-containing histidine kinase [Alicyclobacillaceae bacterium MYW30-H2]
MGIRSKLMMSYFVIVVITLVISGIIFNVFIPRYFVQSTENTLLNEAKHVVQTYENISRLLDNPLFSRRILVYLPTRSIQGTFLLVDLQAERILARKGTINVSTVPLIQKIRPVMIAGKTFSDVYPVTKPEFVLVAYPIHTPESPVPTESLVIVAKLQDIQDISQEIVTILLRIFLVVGAFVVFLGLFMARSITRPIARLKQAVQRLNKRDFTPSEIIKTGDELEDFSVTLHQVIKELKQYDEGQRRFLQNASHELKTPLMAIQGYAEGIKDGIFQGSEAEKGLDTIVAESGRLKKMVDELIYLSKLETMQDLYRPVRLNLYEMLADTVERLGSLAHQNHISILIETDKNFQEQSFLVAVDPDKCLQAFINIIGNAIRHANTKVVCTCEKTKTHAIIQVIDDGKGFGKEDLNRIFERFYRGEKGDTGLGLAITRAIVEKSGGTIHASNHPQGGGAITVSLPCT